MIKIANINTWHGGLRLEQNLKDYMSTCGADMFFLQEVLNSSNPTHPFAYRFGNKVTDTTQLPYSVFHQTFELDMENGLGYVPYGLALTSRFPLYDTTTRDLLYSFPGKTKFDNNPQYIPDMPRQLLHTKTDINGKTYNLINLQGVWAPDGNETEKQKEMGKIIIEYVKDLQNVIMAGDFNIREQTQTIQTLSELFTNPFQNERTTSFNLKHKDLVNNPGYAEAVVDFIFVSKNLTVTNHYTADADISDHQTQVVELDI